LAGTVFWDAAQRAFRKVRAVLSAAALKYLDKFAVVFHRTLVGASDYSNKGELIDRLVMASLLAEFRLLTTEEIKRWILSFGKHAVVLEPEELRAEIVGELDAVRELYAARGAASAKGEKR